MSTPGQLRWPADAPLPEGLHTEVPDERGGLSGYMLRFDHAKRVAKIDVDSVLDTLTRSEPLTAVLSGLVLLPRLLAEHDPGAGSRTDRAMALLAQAMLDTRTRAWQWGGSDQVAEFRVDTFAAEAFVGLHNHLRLRRPERDDSTTLLEMIARGLRQPGPDSPAWPLLHHADKLGNLAAAVGEQFERAIQDPTRPARARWAAFEMLRQLRADASHELEVLDAVITGALDRFVAHFHDHDDWMQATIRTQLAAIAPARLSELSVAWTDPDARLPDPAALSPVLSSHPRETIAAAGRVHPDAVIRGLGEDDPREVLAALLLAPFVGAGIQLVELSRACLARIGDPRRIALRSERVRIGDVAGPRLASLLSRCPPEHRDPLLDEVLDLALATELDARLYPGPGVSVLLTRLVRDERFGPRATARLRATTLDRDQPASARYLASLAFFGAERTSLQLTALLNEDEDPGYRTLIGTSFLAHDPGPLAERLDTREAIWTSSEVLPLCHPAERLPLSWLVESLRLAEHDAVRHMALGAVVNRVLGDRPTPAHAAALLALDVDPPLVDMVEQSGSARHEAARWLALRGDAGDIHALTEFMATDGGWLEPADPNSPLPPHLARVVGFRRAETVASAANSVLEDVLALGYGPERVDGIVAQALARIAQRQLEAGRTSMALGAARAALEREPANLMARSLLARLETSG